jgi:hypothetical protein
MSKNRIFDFFKTSHTEHLGGETTARLEIEAELSFVKTKVSYIDSMVDMLAKFKKASYDIELRPERFDDLTDYLVNKLRDAKLEQFRLEQALESSK